MENTEESIWRRGRTCRLTTRPTYFSPSLIVSDDILSYAALQLQMYSLSWHLNHVLTMKDKGRFVYKRGISYTMLLLLLNYYQIP